MQRDAILSVDGQEILNFGRQSIPTFVPGHRLNSGPFGTMGVGLPFAVGAKAAKPDSAGHLPARRRLVRAERDGARHRGAPQIAAAVRDQPQRRLDRRPRTQQARPRPRLHPLRQDGRGLGCYGEYVEEPEDIRPALERARKKVEEGMVGLVNVKTDYRARATTVRFSNYMT